MSFILDALRKSESERQRLNTTGIADLPLGRRRAQPWWIVGIAVLLLANFVLLAVVLLRPNAEPMAVASTVSTPSLPVSNSPPISTPAQPMPALPPATTSQSLADDAVPPQIEYDMVDRATMEAASAVPDGPRLVRPATTYAGDAAPSSVPPLRVDMHVYSPQRESRFVFINMRKYFEGQALQEGPTVDQITATGVVLSHQGRRWELDRP